MVKINTIAFGSSGTCGSSFLELKLHLIWLGDGAAWHAAVVIVPRGMKRVPSCENERFQFEIILTIPAKMGPKL